MLFLTYIQSPGFLRILILLVSSFLFVSAQEQDICPEPQDGRPSCFSRVCTWISKYKHHNTEQEIEVAFARLADKGITCVYFNVWANGELFFESPTGRSMNATITDILQYAVRSAQAHGIKLTLWFEYGNTAGYEKLNPFAEAAARNDWLLKNGDSFFGINQGLYMYMDQSLPSVQKFIANIMLDALWNYEIEGVQIDDHFLFPNGYDKTEAMTVEQKTQVSYNAMGSVVSMVKAQFPNKIFSYSPAPLHFSIANHNINWGNYFNMTMGPDEIVPQYYRVSYDGFHNAVSEDLKILPATVVSKMMAGLRLSGSALPLKTPCTDLAQMIRESEILGFDSLFFWFANDMLDDYFIGIENLFDTAC